MILKDNVDFLVGTFTAAEGRRSRRLPRRTRSSHCTGVEALQLMAPENIHPYVFRTASTTAIEGSSAAELIAKLKVKRVATMSPDYTYGQEVTAAFVKHLKKIKPDMEIVDSSGPSSRGGLHPFINANSRSGRGVVHVAVGRPLRDIHQAGEALGYLTTIKPEFIVAAVSGFDRVR